jgi:hypothetical protein
MPAFSSCGNREPENSGERAARRSIPSVCRLYPTIYLGRFFFGYHSGRWEREARGQPRREGFQWIPMNIAAYPRPASSWLTNPICQCACPLARVGARLCRPALGFQCYGEAVETVVNAPEKESSRQSVRCLKGRARRFSPRASGRKSEAPAPAAQQGKTAGRTELPHRS